MEWNDMYGVERAFRGKLLLLAASSLIFFMYAASQFNVVFIRPTLTNKHTIAMFNAAARSDRSLSLRILLVLLLLAIASMYMSAKL